METFSWVWAEWRETLRSRRKDVVSGDGSHNSLSTCYLVYVMMIGGV